MYLKVVVILNLALLVNVVGCSEDAPEFGEYTPAMVWGSFYCDACTDEFHPEGMLGEGDEEYFGFCRITDSGLNFVVAEGDPNGEVSTTNLYFEVTGIAGPPTVGVYEEGESIWDDPSLYTTFSSMRIMNFNVWIVNPSDLPYPDDCYVRLFAEPAEGELTPEEFGSNPFEYFVYVVCTGLDEEATQGGTLHSTSMKIWFDSCEET